MNKRCNNFHDCEDGTDEVNCTCKDYLLKTRPLSICDGNVDCFDGSDEDNCGTKTYNFINIRFLLARGILDVLDSP